MKQHSTPLIVKDDIAVLLDKVDLKSNAYDEGWIQDICFDNRNLLPTEEIETAFGEMVPICKELSTNSGYADLIYLNQDGFIAIGECKLWRNPEARRQVVGQILDYAKDLSKWNYEKFQDECLKARKGKEETLFQVIQELYPDAEESRFIDNIQNNLRKGRFLLAIIGDGIHENMEEMADYIDMNGNLNFTLSLIELPVYRNPVSDEIIITPRVLSKTVELERIIYRISDTETVERSTDIKDEKKGITISEKVYYERLTDSIGKELSEEFRQFVQRLNNELNIIAKLGRGKKISLNLKSPNDSFNFASIQEDGQVWFYGIVGSAREAGDQQIGIDYLKDLAGLVDGEFYTKYSEWNWCVKKNGQFPIIDQFLQIKNEWADLISETLHKLNMLEEEI